jgi:hypothetical protein
MVRSPTDEEHRHKRIELVATVMLAVAAVATAWSTYQSAQWRGDQASDTGKATAAHIASSQASTRAGQQTQVDIATFTQWIDASVAGKTKLADFYRKRFRPEFQPAFDAWIATHPLTSADAPLTPFELPQYRLAETTESEALNAQATEFANAASRANKRADAYMLGVVLFATALFFAGISNKIPSARQREFVVVLGAVILVGTAVWIATQPAQFTR